MAESAGGAAVELVADKGERVEQARAGGVTEGDAVGGEGEGDAGVACLVLVLGG